MLVSRSTAEALPTRFVRLDPGKRSIWRTEYLGPPPSARGATLDHGTGDFVVPAADSPQSFRIEQEAGIVVQPHFHFVNQFQVVVAGSASIGRNDATPITVHYAGAHTGYGPVTAGPQGVTYFTLRAQSDGTGAQYLPAARARMQKGPKRYILADPCPVLDSSALASLANAVAITMIDEADGIGAWVVRVPSGASGTGPDPAQGGGQSVFVARGSMHYQGQELDLHSCLYLSPDEAPLTFIAGARGLELVFCQYPTRAE